MLKANGEGHDQTPNLWRLILVNTVHQCPFMGLQSLMALENPLDDLHCKKYLETSCRSISRYFLQAPVNIFRNQTQNGSKGHYCYFVIQLYNPTKIFSSIVGQHNPTISSFLKMLYR